MAPIDSEQEYCPNCGTEEDIVEACSHCGHIYSSPEGYKKPRFILILVFFILGILVTGFIAWNMLWWVLKSTLGFREYWASVFIEIGLWIRPY